MSSDAPVSVHLWQAFARFNVVGVLGIGVQLGTLALLTAGAGLPYLPATVIAVGAAIVHNFIWHALWTWRSPGRRRAGVRRSFARFLLANGAVSMVGNVAVMLALAGGAGLPPVPANAVAIAASGVLNFVLADRWVFRDRRPSAQWPTPRELQP